MTTILTPLAVAAGVAIVATTLLAAIRTVVVPRAESVGLTRVVFLVMRKVFDLLARSRAGYAWSDRVMALYAPVTLLTMPLVWLASVFAGFALLFWAAGERPFTRALETSGSSLLTLGFARPDTGAGLMLAFVGASIAIAIIVLLLVTYLPAVYAAFSRRERLVSLLESRAGSPPTGAAFIARLGRIQGLDQLDPIWEDWERWFADVQESHTSLPALAFFRSQRPDHSWVVAAGALLDAASIYVSCVDFPRAVPEHVQDIRMPRAELCIRAGYLCLRHVAGFFRIDYDADPRPDDPISISREEFDDVWDRLADAGVPLVADRDAAWTAFAGWRVNYDSVLLDLADLTVAPVAPWVSDRSPPVGPGTAAARRGRRK